jgi:non-specific serine/threonine protein kinase
VASLTQFEAVRLFIDRAAAALPNFAVTDQNAPAVAQICWRLDGIPLAIELAAARVRVLTIEQIAVRLDDRFRLLTGGSRTALRRQQTLRAAVDWSYQLMTEAERILLRRLAVFAGGWSLEAAEAVVAYGDIAPFEVLDLLTSLVNKSLVGVDPQQAARYHFLETIRQYAFEKLVDVGEVEAVRDRHRDWCVTFAEQAEPHLTAGDQAAWLDALELERDNLRAALAWCRDSGKADPGLRLAAALSWYWYVREEVLVERREWLECFLRPTAGPASPGPGERRLRHSSYVPAKCTIILGPSPCGQTGDRGSVVRSHWLIGRFALWQGDTAQARTLFAEGVTLAQELADTWALAEEIEGLGWVALDKGKNAAACHLLEESLLYFRASQDWRAIAYALILLGVATYRQGDIPAARVYLEESLAINRRLNSKGHIARVLCHLGVVARNEGDDAASRAFLEECGELASVAAPKWLAVEAQVELAWLAHEAGDARQARTLIRETLVRYPEEGDHGSVAAAGILAIEDGEYRRGSRLLGRAEKRGVLPDTLPPDVRRAYEQSVATTVTALGGEAFAAARAEGQSMTLEQLVAYALGDDSPQS